MADSDSRGGSFYALPEDVGRTVGEVINSDYVILGQTFVNSFALHEHPQRAVRHQHDGGALAHEHEDGSHLLDPQYER